MNYSLLEETQRVVENKQVLINVIARRVRQLSSGIRPLVETELSATYADIAMAELLAGKIEPTFRSGSV